jgi:hypothetical protein
MILGGRGLHTGQVQPHRPQRAGSPLQTGQSYLPRPFVLLSGCSTLAASYVSGSLLSIGTGIATYHRSDLQI